ncbi:MULTISPECIES: molybdopterin synthase sulfur carrier subunit [unclassified Colwellia]|jgi:molybdopterin synthase sulfur carrier subunit|uniref:molybdopterin synthase sulfur carrier subunit n=1 Tax=unclassified Colwellia TaxID=196834 RepID=UPI0015F617E7|nr:MULTISPECIES: molybdopterin synthase sulfur carrier subunit [unclassified Colwellia]MBA6288968.1 molybdopterin synthase sulfur carrier subunit [Colwellia sp. MB3u-4]MBA6339897.1 molybdopterin synthase sulfur carrier subunit [Colwellia sp. MB02u-10]
MIKVLFFARLREQLSTDSLQISASENMTTELIRQQLANTDDLWAKVMSADSLLVAVNQQITDWSHSVNAGDEVAFFPPVTGG